MNLNTATLFTPSNPTRTSRLAARQSAGRAPTCAQRVLRAIANAGAHGATQDELARDLGLPLSNVCARVNGLGNDGSVVALKTTRPTSHGAQALVFVLPVYVDGRPLENWPARREDWRARALAAEARLRELSQEIPS